MITVTPSGGDDTAALQAAANAAAGGTLMLEAGDYYVSATVMLSADTRISGSWLGNCRINILGTSEIVNGIFDGRDKSGILIEGIHFHGNNVSTQVTKVGALFLGVTSAATADIETTIVRRCKFSNFKQDIWLSFRVESGATHSAKEFICEDCIWESVYGNSRYYNNSFEGSTMLDVWASSVGAAGFIGYVRVSGHRANGIGVTAFCRLWSNIHDWHISDNVVRDVAAHITGYLNVYVFLVYTSAVDWSGLINGGGVFANNIVENNAATAYGPGAALYCATVSKVVATGNRISGIRRDDSSGLRRGGLVFNGVGWLVASNNNIYGCSCGIAVFGSADQMAGPWNLGLSVVSGNTISAGNGGSSGIDVSWTNSGTMAPKISVTNNATSVQGTKFIKNPGSYGTIIDSGNV